MSATLIELKEDDLPFVKEIYDYHTLHTTVVYFLECPTIEALKTFIPIGDPLYQSFRITNEEGDTIGFCYYSKFRPREAFKRSVEVTIYLKHGIEGRGYGKDVLLQLESMIRTRGFANIVALIGGENEKSIHMFEKAGYTCCANIQLSAEKFGRKLDLRMYQKLL